MLSAFVIGAYSAYWLWNNNQPKPFFKDYKTVAEINGCHFNVTEDTIDGLKEFDKYKTRILDSGINCKNIRGYTSSCKILTGDDCYGMQ